MAKSNKTTETQATETRTEGRDMNAIMTQFGGVKSKAIRFLASEGLKTSEIVKEMKKVYPDFIYQHARNVLNQKVKGS
jgi:hypothetical protein